MRSIQLAEGATGSSPELTNIGIARRSGNCSSSGVWDIGAYLAATTALLLATKVAGTADDAVELQRNFRAADGYFAADQTSFWGAKIG